MSSPVAEHGRQRQELIERHQQLYESPEIDAKLRQLIREGPQSKLSDWDVHRILRTARAVVFDTHVEVVSGHHTATYLRFASIVRVPQLVRLIARDMADWIRRTYEVSPVVGLLTASSEAQVLAETVVELLREALPLRLVTTPYDFTTGRIGTELASGTIRAGERFLVLNDVTTRGNCVSKLGRVVTDHGGHISGMLVFARRDSGQFPLMETLTTRHRFYYTADLDMPQWEPADCPLCRAKQPLFSWTAMPEL